MYLYQVRPSYPQKEKIISNYIITKQLSKLYFLEPLKLNPTHGWTGPRTSDLVKYIWFFTFQTVCLVKLILVLKICFGKFCSIDLIYSQDIYLVQQICFGILGLINWVWYLVKLYHLSKPNPTLLFRPSKSFLQWLSYHHYHFWETSWWLLRQLLKLY